MTVQLNTAHPLHANLIALIGVEDDGVTIKDFKTPSRTFTPNAAVSYGSGTYGRHFATASNSASDTTPKGVAISPTITLGGAPSAVPSTIFIAVNRVGNVGSNGSNRNAILHSSGAMGCVYAYSGSELAYAASAAGTSSVSVASTTDIKNSGAHSLAATTTSANPVTSTLYVDKVSAGTSGSYNKSTSASEGFSGIATTSFTSGQYEVVWIAVFNKVLSPTEIADLHDSLGANNAFALVQAPASDLSGAATASALASATLSGGGAQLGGDATATATGAAELTPPSLLGGAAGAQGDASASLSLSAQALAGAAAGVAVASADLSASGPLAPPAITSEPLANNTGLVLASRAGISVRVYAAATGAAVVMRSGLATNAAGVLTLGDAALAAGVAYHVIVVMADGAAGFFSAVAA